LSDVENNLEISRLSAAQLSVVKLEFETICCSIKLGRAQIRLVDLTHILIYSCNMQSQNTATGTTWSLFIKFRKKNRWVRIMFFSRVLRRQISFTFFKGLGSNILTKSNKGMTFEHPLVCKKSWKWDTVLTFWHQLQPFMHTTNFQFLQF